MPTMLVLLIFVLAIVLVGVGYALWNYWEKLANVSPEEEAYDRRVATLNQRQANRLNDQQVRQVMTQDDAWAITVQRGHRAAHRRDRYAGDMRRRTRSRRP